MIVEAGLGIGIRVSSGCSVGRVLFYRPAARDCRCRDAGDGIAGIRADRRNEPASARLQRGRAARRAKKTSTAATPDGSTPLQWAVYNGDVAEARRLLRAGADVSLANNYGATPMSLAAEVGNTDMLKVLLEAGANVESPNADGQTALLPWRERATWKPRNCCWTMAPRSMRKRSGADRPPLMWASARRHPEMMQLLIAKGADVNARFHGSQLSASRDGRGASQEPRQRWVHTAALCRTRELQGVRGGAAREQGGHRLCRIPMACRRCSWRS